jgi:uncharacterized protein (TIGR02117 family)
VIRRTLLALVSAPLLYLAAIPILFLVPANSGWREAERGVIIFVNTNGVHTGIGMPMTNRVMDWRPYVPAEHLRAPVSADHVIIGYGHRDFYLNTPSWAELSLATAADAALGLGTTLLHVDHVVAPREGPEQVALTLSEEEYRRLVEFIRLRFRLDPEGRTVPVPSAGYYGNDAFYEANGGYSAILTCNEWTGRALRAAGVRMGRWTPIEQSVMWRLR